MNNIAKGLSIVLTSLLFSACGGGGGGSTTPTVETTPFSTISGTISDGPIENAKVCITDVELDSEYCPTFTDANGKYSFEYIVENGKQYLITAYGSDGTQGYTTYDRTDNLDSSNNPIPLDFVMFQPLKISGSIASTENIGSTYTVNVNPVTFRDAIKTYGTTSTSPLVQQFVASYQTLKTDDLTDNLTNNPTELFKKYIVNNSSTNVNGSTTNSDYTTFLGEVKTKVELVNTAAQNAVTPTQTYITIPDSGSLETQLIKGETYNTVGLEDLINTHIAYKVIYDARNSSSSAYSIFKKITSGTNIIVNFKYVTTKAEYQGTVMFDSNGDLIDANYYQDYTDSDSRGGNKLSGYIKIKKDENGDDILSLRKGQFKIYADNYVEGSISGNVTVENAITSFASTTTNDNTISNSNAVLSVLALPTLKIVASDFVGIWNGTYSVTSGSCTAGNMTISFDSSNGSWNAGNYGVEAILDSTTNKVTLNNGTTIWSSDGTLNTDKTTISGTWVDGTCTGTYTTTKQTAN